MRLLGLPSRHQRRQPRWCGRASRFREGDFGEALTLVFFFFFFFGETMFMFCLVGPAEMSLGQGPWQVAEGNLYVTRFY